MEHDRSFATLLEARVPPPIVMTVTALLMWVISLFSPLFELPSLAIWAGTVLLGAASVGLVFAGLASFRRSSTTIDPIRPGSASTLVTDGIYRFTRNPMYLGFAGALTAWGLHLQAWWSLPLPLLFGLYITLFQIRPEERALRSRFGVCYSSYSATVRRWL